MAKASSPVRLQEDLMQSAASMAKSYHRSTAEQIEYWADIGRQTDNLLNPDVLLNLLTGVSTITVTPVENISVDANNVFKQLEADRDSGLLKKQVKTGAIQYQVCESHPNYLEKIDTDGTRTIGQFKDGIFNPK